ncbi:hypothetical protein NDU88_005596 [Pleurodeles waltl]|uniref:Uncharacterized protein n=1 Tax=Pleurodeles waltl TaxID=8319 RepID=A0AAV7LLW4_PLEWA|nr:hypothetical protein NDU88_005596 [Pleurodeles waltl]
MCCRRGPSAAGAWHTLWTLSGSTFNPAASGRGDTGPGWNEHLCSRAGERRREPESSLQDTGYLSARAVIWLQRLILEWGVRSILCFQQQQLYIHPIKASPTHPPRTAVQPENEARLGKTSFLPQLVITTVPCLEK